jgi:hypothetical protein
MVAPLLPSLAFLGVPVTRGERGAQPPKRNTSAAHGPGEAGHRAAGATGNGGHRGAGRGDRYPR